MNNNSITVIDFIDFDDSDKKKLIVAQIHKACTKHGFSMCRPWHRCTTAGDFTGTYGDYLLNKIGKVFPDLITAVL